MKIILHSVRSFLIGKTFHMKRSILHKLSLAFDTQYVCIIINIINIIELQSTPSKNQQAKSIGFHEQRSAFFV